MKKPVALHPLLFALFPVVFLWSQNVGRVLLPEVLASLAGLAVITALLWFLANLPVRDVHRSGFLISLLVLCFFSYGPILGLTVRSEEAFALWLVFLFLLIPISWFVLQRRRDLSGLSRVLNGTAIFLLALQVAVLILGYGRVVRAAGSSRNNAHRLAARLPARELPNIYYIILDAYGRSDTLRRVYSCDNSEFINHLRKKGFYVADRSASNYPLTYLSLPSSLHCGYLEPDPVRIAADSIGVAEFLKSNGYTVVTVSSTVGQYGYPPPADIHIVPGFGFPEFQEWLIKMTPLDYCFKKFFALESEAHRRRILFALTYLDEALRVRKPVFIYAHILSPHPPFVFDRTGGRVHSERKFTVNDGNYLTKEIGVGEYRTEYREQVMFLNRVVETEIDTILAQARGPLVIILQGDHGPRSTGDWNVFNTVDIPERLGILNAYFFSDHDYGQLYDTITPVNSFRVVFNKYFHAGFHLLPDRSYYVNIVHPSVFRDVTDILTGTAPRQIRALSLPGGETGGRSGATDD